MSNNKQQKLKAILAANPNAPAVLQVGSDTEGLLPTEVAAVLGAAWPDDSPPWVTMYVNYPPWGINVRSDPSNKNKPVGSLVDGAAVWVDPARLVNGYVPVGPDSKTFVLYSLLVDKPIQPTVLLNVPWLSQWTENHVVGDKHTINDCGVYCVEMLRRWAGLPPIDPPVLTAQTTLATKDTGLATSQLVKLAADNDLPMTLHDMVLWADIQAELDAGRPVLSLLLYRPLTGRQDQQDTTGEHFANVIGYGDGYVILADPDWWPTGGEHWRVPATQFAAAVAQCVPPRQVAFVNPRPPVTVGAKAVGYDIYHDNAVDIARLYNDAAFIFHKSSQGTHFTDPAQKQRFATLSASGFASPLHWGLTHAVTNGSVSGQLDNLMATIPTGCQPVIALDVEHFGDAEGDATLTTLGVLVSAIKSELGQYPLIYTRANYFDGLVAASPAATGALDAVKKCELWVASQNDSPTLPNAWTTWAFQQYAQTTPNDGVSTTVDTDRFNGDRADLATWWDAHRVKSIQVVPAPSKSTAGFGVQCLGGVYESRLADYPCFKAIDNPGAVADYHQRNPTGLAIHRHYYAQDAHQYVGNDPHGAAQRWINENIDTLKAMPFALHEGFNEAGSDPLMVAFEIERVTLMAQVGARACVLNLSTGTYNDDALWKRDDMLKLANLVQQHDGAIGLHCYGEGVLSSNCGPLFWKEDGSWSGGDPFPPSVDFSQCWLALRIGRVRQILQQAGLEPLLVATELGLDDNYDGGKNGVFKPLGLQTRGWKDCKQVWQHMEWLNGTTPEAFYRKQLDWFCRTANVLGLVYAFNDTTTGLDGQPGVFDVKDVL